MGGLARPSWAISPMAPHGRARTLLTAWIAKTQTLCVRPGVK
jgi:hypothetical protein